MQFRLRAASSAQEKERDRSIEFCYSMGHFRYQAAHQRAMPMRCECDWIGRRGCIHLPMQCKQVYCQAKFEHPRTEKHDALKFQLWLCNDLALGETAVNLF